MIAAIRQPRASLLRLWLSTTDQEGQGYAEYAFIILFVGLLLIAVVFVLGQKTHNTFCNISGQVGNAQH